MAPAEALALQGFSHVIQRDCYPPLSCKELMDIAGNAFNGAVCLAVITAVVGGADWAHMRRCWASFEGREELSATAENEGPSELSPSLCEVSD